MYNDSRRYPGHRKASPQYFVLGLRFYLGPLTHQPVFPNFFRHRGTPKINVRIQRNPYPLRTGTIQVHITLNTNSPKQNEETACSAQPTVGQKFPRYFKRDLEFFAVFQNLYLWYSTIYRGTPNDARRNTALQICSHNTRSLPATSSLTHHSESSGHSTRRKTSCTTSQ
jgi:hypothetical protein